jgi:hypothetical protein
MDFLLRNKIYLLPVVLVALMFGYFFYFSFNFDFYADDYTFDNYLMYDLKKLLVRPSYRNMGFLYFIIKYDMEFYGKYFMTSIFMSSIFVIFIYVLSWYLNFRFLFTVKNKIKKDSGIFLIIFIIFIAINNSLMNLFWYSSFACHIFTEMLLFLMMISYVRLFNSSNFEKMENKGFFYKFLLCCYLLILSYLVGNGTESTSLFAILVIFVLVIYLIKKYKKIYFWYFVPLIGLIYYFYHQTLYLNSRGFSKENTINFLLDKINHFFVYFFKNLWVGYKYFLVLILGYLIVLSLKYFKKINIVNSKDFNISSLFLLGFFVNLAILMAMLMPEMFIYSHNIQILNIFNVENFNIPRWYTMADVFLGLFFLYFCWFLIKEFKWKKNIKYIIGLLFFAIFSNFVINNIIIIKNSNYYSKHLIFTKYEVLQKIKNQISISDCYKINNSDLEKIGVIINKNNFQLLDKKNTAKISDFDNDNYKLGFFMWFKDYMYKLLNLYKIDVNKIKFEGTCDLKDKKVKR